LKKQTHQRFVQDDEHNTIKYLLALAYIPSADVVLAFETLQELGTAALECKQDRSVVCPSDTALYDRFEDLCIGRLRPNAQRSSPMYPLPLWHWIEAMSQFDNLLMINSNIKQWHTMYRVRGDETC
jgi:hypothetical protein